MPYYRKYKKRPYNRRRKTTNSWARAGSKVGNWAYQAYRGVKYLKGLVNAELKRYDVDTSAGQIIDNTGTVTSLSSMAAGNDVNQRSGNSILAKTEYMRLRIQGGTGTNVTNSVRCVILKDMENTGSAPTTTDILQIADVTSPLNVDHLPRYQILHDKVYHTDVNGSLVKEVKIFKHVNDHLKYTGTSAGNDYKNALYMLLISDIPSGGAAARPTAYWYSRLAFYDN